MEMKKILLKAGEWVGLLVVFGGLGSLWINTEVERRMNELAVDPASTPAVVANTTTIESLKEGQSRIEGKVDAFSDKFLAYLEREASR